MKKILLLNIIYFTLLNLSAQCPVLPTGTRYEPYISNLTFSLTSPWGAVGAMGTATFTLGNCGPLSMNFWNNGTYDPDSRKLVVIISPSIIYTVLGSSLASGVTLPTGTFASKFSWNYNPVNGTLTGTQNADIDAFTSGTIIFPYKNIKISNSTNISPCDGQANCAGTQVSGQYRGFNGMVVNIQPPSQPSNSFENTTNNNLGRYEFTNTSLPIESLELKAKLMSGKKVELNWITNNEINSLKYEVERYDEESKTWSAIGSLAAAGISGQSLNYQLIDNLSEYKRNKVYYRVKSIDNDNLFKYSQIRLVNLLSNARNFTIRSFPNPFQSSLLLELESPKDDKANIKITDILGKVKYSGTMSITKGINKKSFNVSDLSVGNYILTAEMGEDLQVLKIIKVE